MNNNFINKYNTYITGFIIFLVFLIVYLIHPAKSFDSGDMIGNSYLPVSILKYHNIFLGRILKKAGLMGYWAIQHGKHFVSKTTLGVSITALPFYVIPILLGFKLNVADIVLLNDITAATISALSVCLIYIALKLLKTDRVWQIIGAIFYGLGTETFSISSRGLWPEGPVELWVLFFLISTIVIVNKKSTSIFTGFINGFSFGMVCIVNPPDILLIFPLLVWIIYKKLIKIRQVKQIFFIFIGFLITVGPILYYNWKIFGGPFSTGFGSDYKNMFSFPLFQGIIGNLFSPSKGLFIYDPLFIFSFAWFINRAKNYKIFIRDNQYQLYIAMMIGTILLIVLFYSPFFQWSAGYCYGDRYMTDVAPFLTILSFSWLNNYYRKIKNKIFMVTFTILIALFCLWSIFLQGIGVYASNGLRIMYWNIAAGDIPYQSEPLWSIKNSEPLYYFDTFISSFKSIPEITKPKVKFKNLKIAKILKSNKSFQYINNPESLLYKPNTLYYGQICLNNRGKQELSAFYGSNLNIIQFSYHIYKNKKLYKFNGMRAFLLRSVFPKKSIIIYFYFLTPSNPGKYTYVFTLLQVDDGIRWFQNGDHTKNAFKETIIIS